MPIDCLFQFHIGTIKSGGGIVAVNSAKIAFQFHIGTIKSKSLLCGLLYCYDFNSTLVRLKAPPKSLNVRVPAYFNSTLVRLKAHCKKK